ncbi:MAG: uroporphyrin-3 C-methyltransferase [Alteromonadaceae bacterium]|jgi:uroporphyrin-3 C-methyltransferase
MAEQQNSVSTDNDIEAIERELAAQQLADKQHKAKQKNAKAQKRGGSVTGWIAIFLAVVALAGVGGSYWLWQQSAITQQQSLEQWKIARNTEQQQLEQQLTQQLASQIKALKANQQQTLTGVNEQLLARVDALQARVNEVSGRRSNDWVLAEVNYLIRIAGRKLWLENDIITSQHLLATANVRLSELNDPSLLVLRKVLSEDIATLRALPNPPISDIHLSLSGLIKTIDALVINSIEVQRDKARPVKDNIISDSPADYKENLFKSVDDFVSRLLFIDYGVAETDIKPLKMPRQQWYLRANLKMKLLQAQVAVLSRDQGVFRDTIGVAINWLEHFKSTDSNVVAMKVVLTDMLSYAIDAKYSDQFEAQKLLDQLLLDRLGNAYQVNLQPPQEAVNQPAEEQVKEPVKENAEQTSPAIEVTP